MKRTITLIQGILCVVFLLLVSNTNAQDEVKQQTLRGYIVDRTTGNGLEGAYIELLNFSPQKTTISGENGAFELPNIPVGHQRIRVELKNYYESVHAELVVAGKQPVITIGMDEKISIGVATVEADRVKSKGQKRRFRNAKMEPIDEMNPVSARAFNIEEVAKYVGGYGDPARIVTNFPGMFNIDDTQNYIVSRGNSPYGMMWEIEGVPIENPHHLATMGNTGAIFPLLNNNLLDNSDFVNGALAAQYGNVYSGVFDVKMRRGNNERFEFLGQLSPFGAELVAEGPFKKKGASFAVAARAGILDLLHVLGLQIGSSASPTYYDGNLKIDIPTKKAGHFSIFAIGGYSNIVFWADKIDTSDIFAERGINLSLESGIILGGVSHTKYFDKQTSLKTTFSYLWQNYYSYRDTIRPTTVEPYFYIKNVRHRVGLSSIFNKKFTAQFAFRAGIHGYLQHLDLREELMQTNELKTFANGFFVRTHAFAQMQYKFSPRLILTLGVQGMYWSLNQKSWSVEPRLALNWYVGARHKLSLGYGWHSKIQTFPISFVVERNPDGSYNNENRELGPTRSHHVVLSYDAYLAKFWSLKANVYAQYNTDIGVQKMPSSLSVANLGAIGVYPYLTGWENTGVAFSYGAELSVEKFFSQGYYGLVSGAYQRAFYRASDMIWRNSAFDAQYIASTVMGKEFKIGKKKRNVIYADLRFNLHGGLPYTPIDLEASRQAGEEVLKVDQAYSERLGMYKRLDVRLGIRINQRKKRISHHIYIEGNNVANFQNDLAVHYNPETQELVRARQFGFIPNLFYQIKF